MSSGEPKAERPDEDLAEDDQIPDSAELEAKSPWVGLKARHELLGSETISFAKVTEMLGPDVGSRLAEGDGHHWALHATGQGIRHGVVDVLRLADLAGQWGRTIRWFSNVLFPSQGQVPGATLATAAESLVIEFAPGLHEEPVVGQDGEEYYPTLVAGQYLTALLRADIASRDALDERLRSFKGRAVESYAGAVRYLADEEIRVDLVVPQPDRGLKEFVRGQLSIESAQQQAVLLDRAPRMVTRTETVVGRLEIQAWSAATFELQPDEGGRAIRGVYYSELRERLRPMLGQRVSARLEITAPDFDWLPKARRMKTTYRLVGVREA